MSYKDLIYSVQGPVATITLNRPEVLNALTINTHLELARAIQQANEDENVRVIILTGAGRAFCSGDDVKSLFLSPDEESLKGRERRLRQLQGEEVAGGGRKLLEINKPSIAAVNGPAVGYGCDLALSCTMRVASEKAFFGEFFLRVGLIPDEGLLLLPRLVGLGKAYEMILTTDVVDAKEAERIGLVNKVVPHEELMNATIELARKVASKPPIAVQLAMEGIRRCLNLPMQEFKWFHALAETFCMESEDHREGALAFAEKREPLFKGK